jgi:hypothetical protein
MLSSKKAVMKRKEGFFWNVKSKVLDESTMTNDIGIAINDMF